MNGATSRRDGGAGPGASVAMVAVLTLAMTFSYCDRYAINFVVEPIKRDLALSDSTVALVQGFTFAMVFVVSGLPLGIYLGAGLALLGGAAFLAHFGAGGFDLPLIGRRHGWQALFLLAGLPGLPVALLIAASREPHRTGTPRGLGKTSTADCLAFARDRRRVLAGLFLCAAFAAATSQAYAAWMPSHLIRNFGWSVPQAGSASGLMIIAGGLSGVLVAGLAGDRLRGRGLPSGRLIVMIGSGLAALLPAAAAPIVADARAALALMLLAMVFTTVLLTSAASAVQELGPNRMQGTVIAVYALAVTVVGLAFGPTAVAAVSDHVLRDEHRIAAALACISLLSAGPRR